MKKKLSLLLLSLAMSFSLAIPASASINDPDEPMNNNYLTAPVIENKANPSGGYVLGYIQQNDVDYYSYTSKTGGKIEFIFAPPDKQKYVVLVTKKSDNGGTGQIPTQVGRFIENGEAQQFGFYPEPNTEYIIQIVGWQGIFNLSSTYYLYVTQHR
ncbi:hypothetical protein [Paenibacillus sp. 481]|uniref:hypothetical protein n=1 Tax=Paenibacillus sp. 481 TaxID=2835869 RepID=UPI001E3BEABA|nr:hypothetical protein [Paenibacillus sp. 481]UHA73079.1 hypothetical protein KIK04_21175 [Paenibacillus sp. 481]